MSVTPAPRDRLGEPALLRGATLVYGIASAAALVVLVVRDRADVARRLVGDDPAVGLAAGLAVGLAAVLASRLLVRAWGTARRAEDALAEIVGPLSLRACVALAVLSGLGEELVFRGVLQPWLGLWLTSMLFGAVHVPPRRALWPWPLLAAVMGLALGVLFDGTGGVLAPVTAHATVNTLNLHRLAALARARDAARAAAAGEDAGREGDAA